MKRFCIAVSFIFLASLSAQYTPPGGGGGGGATIPSVTNLISGSGTGNGADSGIAPATVVKGASNLSIAGCVAFQVSAGTLTCLTGLTWDGANVNVPGGVIVNGGGTGALTMARGTTPAAPASGKLKLFFDSANSDHLSAENSSGAVTDLQPAASTGSYTWLETHTASSSAFLSFTCLGNASYDTYEIIYRSLLPATTSKSILLQFSTDGGSTYDSGTNYSWQAFRFLSNASALGGGTGLTSINIVGVTADLINTSTAGVSGSFRVYNTSSTSAWKMLTGISNFIDSGSVPLASVWGGNYQSTTAVNAFKLISETGNIATGSASCYGISR